MFPLCLASVALDLLATAASYLNTDLLAPKAGPLVLSGSDRVHEGQFS